MNRILILNVIIISLFSQFTIFAQISEKKSVNDLEELLNWFTGEFNNYEQNAEEVYSKEKEGKDIEPHFHVHSIFAPIEFKVLAEHVFHVQQSDGIDQNKIFRQRLYAFTEYPDGKIGMQIHKYLESGKYKNLHKNYDLLKQLSLKDIEDTRCEIVWEREGDKFIGKNVDGYCKTYSQYFEKNIIVKDKITLSKDQIWILDTIYDEDNNLIMGRKDGIPSKSKKCSFYKGWAAIEKTDSSSSDSTIKSKYIGYRGLEIHNQGQHAKLVDKDGNIAEYEVSLSQLTYAASNIHVLKLGVHMNSERTKTKSYIWGEPNAKRLGLNLKWIQAGFTLIEGQRFSK